MHVNASPGDAAKTFVTRYYLSTDTAINIANTPLGEVQSSGLNAGASESRSLANPAGLDPPDASAFFTSSPSEREDGRTVLHSFQPTH